MLSDYRILHGAIPFFFLASSSRSKSSLHAAVTSSSLMDAGNVTKPTQEMSTTLSLGTTTFLAGALAGVALPWCQPRSPSRLELHLPSFRALPLAAAHIPCCGHSGCSWC